ncbi:MULTISPECIES: four helix bundle protein [unclassified Mesorhizobium]|uniref:four helix bundle protein n=1 Tax=unclassified Mesorhizobium TaxID=325217 RepID=UPI000F75CAF7|nr:MULTISPECIES: four helix bundle protein [unclassified Mesorhizobium]AZO23052.1 four helix bundle protein [Mesorhizobium sp. M1E.F.Ca.ET.045.02.1.1]RUW27239.1 four helix bundle protein [Mesorhizobium sp. M1E.F.Ca.ET.041.01.1.1]RUW76645.1 four helix bundle protein [Mesorhizobium sp. M1E.F.Ca.ET.063.01.1.1]RWB60424.1 MAG: four helix bundle protein [Mesorhizobium sp.]RWD80160.1 MAG: four helix bundle protein [Mesorhizobium sp.]
MGKRIESYRDLMVWQSAMILAEDCYRVTKGFPKDEIYGMTSQMRRSAVSIAANIAEGYGRENRGSFVQFLRMAQGSLKELETHVLLACRVGMLERDLETELLLRCEEIGKMMRSLIRTVQAKQAE